MKNLSFTVDPEDVLYYEDSFKAAIVDLSDKVKGWHVYDVVKIDNVHGDELKIYTVDLDNEQGGTIGTFYITVRPGIAEVEGEYYEMVLLHGKWRNYDNVVGFMDDEIREMLHSKLAPCDEQEFVDEYVKEHEKVFGELFEVN